MTENQKEPLSWYIVENRHDQRADIERELSLTFADLFSLDAPRLFDNMEECLEHLSTTSKRPKIVITDLYPGEDKRVGVIFNSLIGERIPLLTKLREALGPEVILIVLTRYKDFFGEGSMRDRINSALRSAPIDGSVDKIPETPDTDWVSNIRQIVESSMERSKDAQNNKDAQA